MLGAPRRGAGTRPPKVKLLCDDHFPDQTTEKFLGGHVYACRLSTGRLASSLHDNLRGVVQERRGDHIHFHPRPATRMLHLNPGLGPQALVERSHHALRSSRGAAVAVARIDRGGVKSPSQVWETLPPKSTRAPR